VVDPEPVWFTDPPQVVIIGGQDPVFYPADPYPGPGSVTIGNPWGPDPVVVDPAPGTVSPAPEPYTLPNPWGDHPIAVDPGGVPATDSGDDTLGQPWAGDPLPPTPDLESIGRVEYQNQLNEAFSVYTETLGVPPSLNPDGSQPTAIDIWMHLMEQVPQEYWPGIQAKIEELEGINSTLAQNPFR
jgi:hypothetical protein